MKMIDLVQTLKDESGHRLEMGQAGISRFLSLISRFLSLIAHFLSHFHIFLRLFDGGGKIVSGLRQKQNNHHDRSQKANLKYIVNLIYQMIRRLSGLGRKKSKVNRSLKVKFSKKTHRVKRDIFQDFTPNSIFEITGSYYLDFINRLNWRFNDIMGGKNSEIDF